MRAKPRKHILQEVESHVVRHNEEEIFLDSFKLFLFKLAICLLNFPLFPWEALCKLYQR